MSFTLNLGNFDNLQNNRTECEKCNCTLTNSNLLNPHDTAKQFCDLYYNAMSSKGCNGALYLFDKDAICNYGGQEMIGFYNVMVAMSTEGILKTFYEKLTCTVLPINNNQISLQITGNIKGLTFWNQYTPQYLFTEVFILTLKNNRIFVTSYSNKLM